jgi:hypothetical protein
MKTKNRKRPAHADHNPISRQTEPVFKAVDRGDSLSIGSTALISRPAALSLRLRESRF